MKKYPGKKFNIPFYQSGDDIYRVKLSFPKADFAGSPLVPRLYTSVDEEMIEQRALNRFITYFFPEFYTYLYSPGTFSTYENADTDAADDLLGSVRRRISIEGAFQDPINPQNAAVVCKLTSYSVDNKRRSLLEDNKLPAFEQTLTFFNEQQSIGDTNSAASFAVGTMGQTNNALNDGLKAFNDQMVGYEGQLPGPLGVDFTGVQMGTQNALNLVVSLLTTQLMVGRPSFQFTEADQLTVYFGTKEEEGKIPRIAITRIDYLLVEDGLGSRPLKVGYLSNIKYNKQLGDPLTLATLKNYQSILDGMSTPEGPTNFSFFNFLDNPDVQGALGEEFKDGPLGGFINELSQMNPKEEAENLFINAAKEFGLIDVNNTEQLEKGFKTAFTSEELTKLKMQVADNPEVYQRVQKANMEKALKKGVEITQKLDNILQQGPMGFISKNPIIELLFRELGLTDLAKEAMLCVTFGLNFEMSRITKAVQKSLAELGSSLYYPPPMPRAGGDITKPKIDLDMMKVFSIDGDLHKAVLRVIVDTLQQTALEMIQKLAEMIKFSCPLNNPRSQDHGANDLADLFDNSLPDRLGGAGNAANQAALAFNLTLEEFLAYLTALSSILSSMDVCILLQDSVRPQASDELIDKIIAFNAAYPLEYVNTGMVTPSQVLTFFTQISKFMNVGELCNAIANEVYVINRDSIEVCLTPYDPLSADALTLVDLIDNGLQIELPEINMDCPDKAGFLSDRTITVSIPEVFSTLTQVVELQFLESVTSVRESLLEPRLVSGDGGSDVFNNMEYAEVSTDELGEINPEVLNKVIDVLDQIASFDLSSCPIDLSQILGFDAAAGTEAAQAAIEAVTSTLANPEFQGAIEGIRSQLEELSPEDMAALGPNSLTAFSSYRFNLNFLQDYVNYIDMREMSYANGRVSIPLYFNSKATQNPDAGFSALELADASYRPIHLEFNFPFLTPFNFGARDMTLAEQMTEQVTSIGQLDVGGNIVATSGCLDPEKILSRILWNILMVTFRQEPGYNYQTFMAERGATSTSVLATLPTFLEYAPVAYNQLRFAGQASTSIPLKQLTPQLLIAVQDYFGAEGDRLQLGGIIAEAAKLYEDVHNCTITFTEDIVGYVRDSVAQFADSDLEITRSYMRLSYPREAPDIPNLALEFQSDGDFIPEQKVANFITTSVAEQEFEQVTQDFQNVYVKQFVDKFTNYNSFTQEETPLTIEEKRLVEAKHFPAAYASLVDRMFDYTVRNGVFDAATMQQLNLLPSPPNCPPSESGDLLDIEGIFEQMRAEYVEARCSNDSPKPPLRETVRNIIKYGLYLMFVQSNIAEIIVKNIFVLTAFRVDTILTNRDGFIFAFLRSQLVMAIDRLVDAQARQNELTIQQDLVAYFNRKIQRQLVVSQGGIRYGDGRVAFLPGTRFTIHGEENSASFNDIINYLIEDRLVIGGTAINNVLRNALPDNSPLPMDEAFLASLPTYTADYDTIDFIAPLANNVFTEGNDTCQVFVTRKLIDGPLSRPRARIKVWYYHADGTLAPIFSLQNSIPVGEPQPSMFDRIRSGEIVVTAEERPDCLDQSQIDQIYAFGGTVPRGRGCPNTFDPDGNPLSPLVSQELAESATTEGIRTDCIDRSTASVMESLGVTVDPSRICPEGEPPPPTGGQEEADPGDAPSGPPALNWPPSED
tara:strand:+ start:10126 stop:15147 length:5022 start_codon:yes stop_codon:yes gene_type:complete